MAGSTTGNFENLKTILTNFQEALFKPEANRALIRSSLVELRIQLYRCRDKISQKKTGGVFTGVGAAIIAELLVLTGVGAVVAIAGTAAAGFFGYTEYDEIIFRVNSLIRSIDFPEE